MIVLHGAWVPSLGKHDAAFALWGESDAALPRARRRAASAGPPLSGTRKHPYTIAGEELRQAVVAIAGPLGPLISLLPAELAIATLPTAEGKPLVSPEFEREPVTEEEAPAGPLAYAHWRLETLPLTIEMAVEYLADLPLTPPEDLLLGDDLRYWSEIARYALSIVARQRFFPALINERRRYAARWAPLLSGWEDAQEGSALVKAQPPVARALTWRASGPPARPVESVSGFLALAVDAVARAPQAALVPASTSYTYWSSQRAWLKALAPTDGQPVAGYELSSLYPYYQSWVAPLITEVAAPPPPLRLCLRLAPPDPGEKEWRLDYLLQALDDPSVLLPAGDIWRATRETRSVLRRLAPGVDPRVTLLAGLGQAARSFPPLAPSLQEERPSERRLSTHEAFAFLREPALKLRSEGIGVQLPAFVAKLSMKLNLGGKSQRSRKSDAPSMFGLERLVEFDWQVALGDQTLSRTEFEALARQKEPLVQVRGQWLELRPELVERVLAFLKQHDGDALSTASALRLALAPEEAADGLDIEEVRTEGWFEDLLDRLKAGDSRESVSEPAGFHGELRGYQKSGVAWLETLRRNGLGACLADDMGLGKTVQVIALLLRERAAGDNGAERGPTLLICPTSVVGNWRRELARFSPDLRVLIHHGAGRNKAGFAEEALKHDIVVSSYALLYRDVEALSTVHWGDVILDEAQNIKNASTKSAQAARRLPSRWRAALTGTPVENRLADLWSIFQFVNPGYLGSEEQFRRQFASRIERDHDQAAAQRLKALVSPFILRRLKSDKRIITDLPEKNEMKVFCQLTREQATLYQAVVQDSLKQIEEADGIQRRGIILATLTRLKQVCNHPAQFLKDGSKLEGRSGKLTRIGEMLEEAVAEGDRALIFTQFVEMGELLKQYLKKTLGEEALFLHGGTPAKQRDKLIGRFQEDDDGPRVFILSIKAGGAGLNLTRANHVFHFDRWWNPAVENQATDRAFRIGQRRDVQVHKLVCAGTLEETIDQAIERKQALSEAIVGANETWITEMSTNELRELLLLRADAVEV